MLLMLSAASSQLGSSADPYALVTLCTSVPAGGRPPVTVASGTELQAALDRATGGDTILLDPRATFRPVAPEGAFVLRRRKDPDKAWVTIRSADSVFEAEGALRPTTRVSASNAQSMPKIRATSSGAVKAEAGARGYLLVGLDIGPDDGVTQATTLVELGSGDETSIEQEPSDIVVDRCYLHGNDAGQWRRGVTLNGVRLAVVDSYLENFHDANGDSQAIEGWNGPGPFAIVNNFLEAAGENIMFGGADPAIDGLVPSDIEIRGNLCTKRLSWRQSGVPVKNAFELKNARRVLVDGNTFENVWRSGQDGTAIVMKSVNQQGRCPWCVTEWVTFSNNVVRDAASAVMINAAETGESNVQQPRHANHIRVQNVLFQNIGGTEWPGGGKLLRVMGGVSDVEFSHITSNSNPNGILDPRDATDVNPNLVFRDNIVERKLYGIGSGGDEGKVTLARNFAPFTYTRNVLVNTSQGTDQQVADGALKSRYPPQTMIAASWAAVGFVSGSHGLAPTSPYYRAGDDGKPVGVDVDALAHAQAVTARARCDTAATSPSVRQARVVDHR
jgi:hypothetical protein